MRILLVEDEEQISKLIKMNLEAEGYEVVTADTGKKALTLTDQQHFDLLILDIMLPEVNGFQVCEKVRLSNSNVAILFLSAKDSTQSKIQGLRLGADDYLTKPFNLEELLLRIQILIKRSKDRDHPGIPDEYHFHDNKINFNSFEAIGKQGIFNMTKKEVLLLKLLVERKNQVVSRQQILQNVWGYDVYPSTRTIDNFILSFRKNFEEDPANPQIFISVRGIGYKYVE
jgi:two-component system, OmpR family, alkaline phosphatase synthesis response regulator PhoP